MSRSGLGLQGKALAALDPEGVRAFLLDHPLSNGGRLWCERVIQGVARGDRTAMRLYGETLRYVGAQVQIGQVLVQMLGVKDDAEAKALVESGRRFRELSEGVSPEQMFAEAGALLVELHKAHPEWRAEGIVFTDSMAEEVGRDNGNEEPCA